MVRSGTMRTSGCPNEWKSPRSSTPWILERIARISPAFDSFTRRLGPTTLMVFSPFTPDMASSTLSAMYCEKLKETPGNASASSRDSSLVIESFVTPRGHSLFGLSGANSKWPRSEEHTSELQSHLNLVCRLLLEKKKKKKKKNQKKKKKKKKNKKKKKKKKK